MTTSTTAPAYKLDTIRVALANITVVRVIEVATGKVITKLDISKYAEAKAICDGMNGK